MNLRDDFGAKFGQQRRPAPRKLVVAGFGVGAILVLALNLALLGAAVWIVVTVLRWTGVIQ